MSLCPLGGGCWRAPRCGSCPVAPGRCQSQPGPAVCRDVSRPVLALQLSELVSPWEPVSGEGAGSLQHPMGKEPLKSARLLGCRRAPAKEGLCGQGLHPCHRPHPVLIPIPVRTGQPRGSQALGSPPAPGAGTFITFIPNLRCKPGVEHSSCSQAPEGSAPLCVCVPTPCSVPGSNIYFSFCRNTFVLVYLFLFNVPPLQSISWLAGCRAAWGAEPRAPRLPLALPGATVPTGDTSPLGGEVLECETLPGRLVPCLWL